MEIALFELRKIGTILIPVLAALALLTGTAVAQQPTPQPVISDDEVNALARDMYCPVCENTPLDVCPTQACAQWRDLIRQKLSEGWDEAQIKDYFVAQYGDRVLSEPPRRGLNWLVYILPPLFFLAGALILWRVLRAMRPAGGQAVSDVPETGSPPADEYVKRLEEELRRRERE